MAKSDDIIAEARKRWNRCDEAEQAQRTLTLTAKQFRAGDQWPSAIKIQRQGQNAIQGQQAVPPRPCLVVDRLSQPVRQISNLIKNAMFGFDVLPNGGGADIETAEIFKGYLRYVQNQSRDESPIEWAADNAVEGGIGWFRLRTDYVHQTWDGDPNDPAVMDQEVRMERITNNMAVYCDPSALKPTRSDALFMFVTEDVDKDEFKDSYKHMNGGKGPDMQGLEAFASTGDNKGWVSEHSIRIAEYWRIIFTEREFHALADGSIVEGKKPKGQDVKISRVMRVPKVEGYKISATEVLEEWDWVGSHIPIIPILGEELNVDGKPVLRGVITEGMDAQRMVNYTYSGAMEIFALAPKAPVIAAAGQLDPYKAMWQNANTTNYAYLPYEPIAIAGTLVGPPQRQAYEAPIQAAVELMRTSEEAIKTTTSIGDPALGNVDPAAHSGRAIQALQGQSDLANSNYPDAVRRSLIYAAEQVVEVTPRITRKGQILQIIGTDDAPQQVMVGQPFRPGPNGQPQPSPEGVTPELAKQQAGLDKFFDLNNGRYAVTVTIGKATATKREEGAAALGELIPRLPPEMAAVITPEFIEQLSMPNAHKIAELARKTLPPNLQPQPEGGQPPLPPQVQQQMQQMQQALQQAQQLLQTDGVKAQADMQKAQLQAQSSMQIEQFKAQSNAQLQIKLKEMDNARAIEVARIGAAKEAMNQQAEAAEERLSTGLTLAHDAALQQTTQAHDAALAAQQHAHALEQGAVGHAQNLEAGAQQASNAQQQQAAQQAHDQQMAAQQQEAQQQSAAAQPKGAEQ